MIVEGPDRPVPVADLGRVHFVGIGGAGMSGIARILLARGAAVSGSDAKDSRALDALRALGASVQVGHSASHVDAADTVVVSTAVREDNPEVRAAQQAGLRLLPRASALASVMLGRRVACVAGTHGKTTTTSMLTVALQHCGADPSFAIGGNLNESGANAHDGTGDIFVAEADESDRSFLLFSPDLAVITNVEPDHLDTYGTAESYMAAFDQFADRLRPDGKLVICVDDEGARRLADVARGRDVVVTTYGEAVDADVHCTGLRLAGTGSAFEVVVRGRRRGGVRLSVPGRHNALNATGAIAAGLGLGFGSAELREGLGGFTGTRRRFELKGIAGGIRVFDDYAHHPTEVVAALDAARQVAGGGRVVACFQPHLFSRTRIFAKQFGQALGRADEVVIMDVFAAREDPEPGVTGQLVADHVPPDRTGVTFEPSWSAVPQLLADRARAGDVVITVGAGDVTLIGPEVLDLLADRVGAAEAVGP